MGWKVLFFQTSRGTYPVKEFIETQNNTLLARINKSIRLLITHGSQLMPPYAKKVSGKLYELRIRGDIPVRIFYVRKNESFYLLHVFKKKSQKIPLRELKTALDRSKEII